jgi:small subunit ribosomal protein S20
VANHKQAVKRNRQRDKARLRNRLVLSSMRTALKSARIAVDSGADAAPGLVRAAVSKIDQAVTKGTLKRKTASRLISRLASRKAA